MTRKTWLLILLCCCILYIPHATPSLAIRTKLIFTGHPVSALTSKVYLFEKNGKRYQPYPEYSKEHHAKVYLISHPPSSDKKDLIVYQKGPIFLAKYVLDEISEIMNV